LTLAREKLESDSVIRNECAKLWSYLLPTEQEALMSLAVDTDELPQSLVLDDLSATERAALAAALPVMDRLTATQRAEPLRAAR